jgi:hypothetical protein
LDFVSVPGVERGEVVELREVGCVESECVGVAGCEVAVLAVDMSAQAAANTARAKRATAWLYALGDRDPVGQDLVG